MQGTKSDFSIKNMSTTIKLSSDSLKEEIKSVPVTEKKEFEYRDESMLIDHFGIFGLTGLNELNLLFQSNNHLKV